jgi:hypothetical protein
MLRYEIMKDRYEDAITKFKTLDFNDFYMQTQLNGTNNGAKACYGTTLENNKILYTKAREIYKNGGSITTKELYEHNVKECSKKNPNEKDFNDIVQNKEKITYFFNFLRDRNLPIFSDKEHVRFVIDYNQIDSEIEKIKKQRDRFKEKCLLLKSAITKRTNIFDDELIRIEDI